MSPNVTTVPSRYNVLGGKKGAAFVLTDENMDKIKILNSSWYYGWTAGPPPQRPPSSIPTEVPLSLKNNIDDHLDRTMVFVPMIWGYYPKSFMISVRKVIEQHPPMIFVFNEPDNKVQSNISVDDAIQAWARLQTELDITSTSRHNTDTRPLIVSPGCVDPLGHWMKEFVTRIDHHPKLSVDVIAVHYYGGPSPRYFQRHLQQIYETYNHRPIIVTEFAVADWSAKTRRDNKFTPTVVLRFMQNVLPWMQSQSWIIGYSWFSFSQSSPAGTSSALFVDSDNCGSSSIDKDNSIIAESLTPLGRYYASFLSSVTPSDRYNSERFNGGVNREGEEVVDEDHVCPCNVQ